MYVSKLQNTKPWFIFKISTTRQSMIDLITICLYHQLYLINVCPGYFVMNRHQEASGTTNSNSETSVDLNFRKYHCQNKWDQSEQQFSQVFQCMTERHIALKNRLIPDKLCKICPSPVCLAMASQVIVSFPSLSSLPVLLSALSL